VALLLTATIFSAPFAIAAEAGSAADPLIALNWIRNTFVPRTVTQAEERIDQRAASQTSDAAAGQELLLKRGDVLRAETGVDLVMLDGEVTGSLSGTVVDVTDGDALRAGSALEQKHRYIVAENSKASFSVVSDTAVVRANGAYRLTKSGETDYNALADALRTMGLLKGTDVPYAHGYELEREPTRIEGLILFLRLIGEEEQALRSTARPVTFTDVPDWALPYAAYAYDKGYAKGVGTDASGRVIFNCMTAMSPRDYMTFLLRSLRYQEGTDFDWSTAVADAVRLKALNTREQALLESGTFRRAQTVYLSYYALSAGIKGEGRTLLDRLVAAGRVDRATANAAMGAVTGKRL